MRLVFFIARLLPSVAAKNTGAAVFGKGDHIIRLCCLPIDLHTGGADGHTGNGKTANRWFFLQQPLNIGGGDMTFNHVAIDDGGVAGL